MPEGADLDLQIILGIITYLNNRRDPSPSGPTTLTEVLQNLPPGISIGTIIGAITQPKEFYMSTYEVGQAGSVGPNSVSIGHVFNQVWDKHKSELDLATLSAEIAELRIEVRRRATGAADEDVALGALANAEIAAKDGDGPGTLEHLRRAGKWIIDVARDIGVSVAVKALESAIGGDAG